MVDEPSKMKEAFSDPVLMAIDSSMVTVSGVDLQALGGGGDGSVGAGGGGGGVVSQGDVRWYHALCAREDHDPAAGDTQPTGIWVGNAHEARGDAAIDADAHVQQTGHGAWTTVVAEIGPMLAGPVLGA